MARPPSATPPIAPPAGGAAPAKGRRPVARPGTGARARRTAAPPAAGDTTGRIVEAITTAIVERRLQPGTKLVEQQIADIFQVSRTLVRQALNQLSRDHLVTLEPARGAFVARPSVDEARQVFEVRKMVETAMIRQLCAVITAPQVAALRAHLAAERDALARTDVSGRTRLLADFHVLLARQLGNEVLARLLADLLSRCSLIALMYQSAHSAEHSQAEHIAIVDALERRDARLAVRLLDGHLGNVERNLQLDPRRQDLAAVLQP
ncbi:MAG: GntR family transcriptional regulator [Ideonella sp.]|nr:GntR family transcriptional regulator [Ideonella sp.]